MSLLGQFAPAVGAMMAQSQKLETIGLNVANLNTGGYKRSETHFHTLLSQTYDYNHDIGGVKAYTKQMITDQGSLQASSSAYDLAVNGNGFFVLNTSVDGTGDTLYGRDGQFEQELVGAGGIAAGVAGADAIAQDREGYMIDKNGYYLQGWPVAGDGTIQTGDANLESIRVDPTAFTENGEGTTEATLSMNIPGEVENGYKESTTIQAFDQDGTLQAFRLEWEKLADANEWNLRVYDGTTALVLDPDDIAETVDVNENGIFDSVTGGDLDTTSLQVTFNGDASILSPTSLAIAGVNNTANFTLDMTQITQFSSNAIRVLNYDYNGASDAVLVGFEFTSNGTMLGSFSDATQRAIYKLPLASFVNPDGLEPINGNVYRQSFESGDVSIVEAGGDGIGEFVPFARELSNVVLEDEFTRMMITQNAYNSASTVFKTIDEMSEVARDLKR